MSSQNMSFLCFMLTLMIMGHQSRVLRPTLPRLPRIPLPMHPRFVYAGSVDAPKLAYSFGNRGALKKVSLQHYDPLGLRNGSKMLCHYLGKVESDAYAVIGVTGCPGEHNVQVTLVSRTLTAQFLLSNVSDIALKIPSPWESTSTRSMELSKTQMENDAIYINQIEHSAVVASLQCSESYDCVLPALHKMTVKIGYDASLFAKEPQTLSWISGVMTHTQTFFYHPSLPTKIQIEVSGSPKFYSNSKWTAETSITSVERYAQGDYDTDLYVFLCADSNLYGTVGIAYVGGLCDTSGYQVSINEWRHTEAETAKVVAHEMGHNMGMSHDFDPNHSGKDCTGIMDYGETPDSWSECSQNDFRNHYFGIKNSGREHCLEVLSESGGTQGPSSCKLPVFNGDGYCDDSNNNEACGFDGGDCCNTKEGSNWDVFCTICKCHHPEGGCGTPSFVGDGYCDDENNNSGCGFDGGDCCLRSSDNWNHFCTECLCKSP